MTRITDHPHADRMLIESVVELGCLAPTYTRAQRPGYFAAWEDRANEVLRQVGFLPIDRTSTSLDEAKAECDRFSGADHRDMAQRLLAACLVAIAILGAAILTLTSLPGPRIEQSAELDVARLFVAPKIALRARAAEIGR